LAQSDIVVEEVVARSVGVSYPAINASDIGKIQVPVPTLSNQARIADFLDAETSRIDALIAKKRRLVALIEERWSTVVAAAVESVDGGGGAPMLRRYLESVVGGSWGAEPGQGMIDARCIRGTDFDFRTLGTNSASAPTRSFNTEEFGARRLGENDLVIEKSGGSEAQPVGRVVRWTGKEPAVPTNFAARIRPSEVVSSKYLAYVFLSAYHAGLTRSWAKQTTGIQNLDIEGLLSEHRALPDVGAQEKAAARLDRYTERVRYVQDRINKQVVTLRERRGALITAAVTGELEIPGTAA
jgi:type I restriction enzyme S subunit